MKGGVARMIYSTLHMCRGEEEFMKASLLNAKAGQMCPVSLGVKTMRFWKERCRVQLRAQKHGARW